MRRVVQWACAMLCGLVAATVLPALARADVGFQGPAYPVGTGGSPTGSKPESKLWWNDGFWWASMFDTSGAYHMFRLRLSPQRWVDTGVAIDGRDSSRQDVLSRGNTLFIASHKHAEAKSFSQTLEDAGDPLTDGMRLYRFTYNTATNSYSLDSGFPVSIDPQRAEALVIDRAADGTLWATWVQQEGTGGPYRVFFSHTNGSCSSAGTCQWTARAPVPGSGDVAPDDISSLVHFDGKIGVMWGDQNDGVDSAMRFASHVDGDPDATWSAIEAASAVGAKFAEDHINLKADGAGRVYAAVRTKFRSATRPGTMLLVRNPVTGNWSSHEVTNASFKHTRPIVLLDTRRIRVFEAGGGAIYMKSSRRSSIAFRGGAGTVVIRDQSSAAVTNPTSTKQKLNGTTQLIVVASNNSTKHYWHAYRQLSLCINGTAGPDTLVGTAGDDRLCGRGGKDVLRGLGGSDVLSGGSGADRLVGGGGRDSLRAGSGNDTLLARDGRRDLVNGNRGFDRARVDARDIRRSIERLF